MKCLVLDTSSQVASLATFEVMNSLRDEEAQGSRGRQGLELKAEFTLNVNATHSENLLWGIHQVMKATRWELETLDALGVGVGPGSFTGLRIGLTTARTLALSLGIPLVGVSSLAALARPLAEAYRDDPRDPLIVATTDAFQGELYALWGSARDITRCSLSPEYTPLSQLLSEGERQTVWKREVREGVLRPEALLREVRQALNLSQGVGASHRPYLVVGGGADRYRDELWSELPGARRISLDLSFLNQVQGRFLSLLVYEALSRVPSLRRLTREDTLRVVPHYLRASHAEKKLNEQRAESEASERGVGSSAPPNKTRGGALDTQPIKNQGS